MKNLFVLLTLAVSIQALGQQTKPAPDSLSAIFNSPGGKLIQSGNVQLPFSAAAKNIAMKQAENLPNLISEQRVFRFDKQQGADSACIESQTCIVDYVELEVTIQDKKEHQKIKAINPDENGNKRVSLVDGDLDDLFNSRALKMTGVYLSSPTIPFNGNGALKDLGSDPIVFADGRQMIAQKMEFDTGEKPFYTLESCNGSPERKIPGHGVAWFDPKTKQLVKLHVDGYGPNLEKVDANEGADEKCPPIHVISQDFQYADTAIGNGKHFWLPKISSVKIGANPDKYLLNFTYYDSYNLFTANSKIITEDEKIGDSPETKPSNPFAK